jgi:DNA-binding PadR family transcriptional regulator
VFRHHHHRGHEAHFGRGTFGGGGFGGDHRHWRGERGGRGERVFESGDLRFVLLAMIAEKPSHGYELIKAIEEKLSGGYTPSPGVVYPTLTLLEELGYVTVEAQDGGKKLYSITETGRAFLGENQRTVDGLFARMDEARSRGGRFSPQIMRAMENLKIALKYRLVAGDLTEADVQSIAAAIDAAALAVEKKG